VHLVLGILLFFFRHNRDPDWVLGWDRQHEGTSVPSVTSPVMDKKDKATPLVGISLLLTTNDVQALKIL